MKNAPHFLRPVHKQLKKYFVEDVIINHLLKIISKNTIELVYDSQHLLQQQRMVRLEDTADAYIEIVVMKIPRQLFVAIQNHIEIAFYQIQTFEHRVSFIKVCFGEYQHHKGVKQFLVLNQLHVASRHFLAYVQYLTVIHLPNKYRQELTITRKVLPHRTPIISQKYECLIPQFRIQTIKKLFMLPVKQQQSPVLIPLFNALESHQVMQKLRLFSCQFKHSALPIVKMSTRRAFHRITCPDFLQFFFTDYRVIWVGYSHDDLLLRPRKAEVYKCNELVHGLNLLQAKAARSKFDNLDDSLDSKFIKFKRKCPLRILTFDTTEILKSEHLLATKFIQNIPNVVVSELLVSLQQLAKLNHNIQQSLLSSEHIVSHIQLFIQNLSIKLLQNLQKMVLINTTCFKILEIFLEIFNNIPAHTLLNLIHIAWSSNNNTILTKHHTVNLLSVEFGFHKDQVEFDLAHLSSLDDQHLLPLQLSDLEHNIINADLLETHTLINFRVRYKYFYTVSVTQATDHPKSQHRFFQLSVANAKPFNSQILSLLMLLILFTGLKQGARIRLLNTALNTIKEREYVYSQCYYRFFHYTSILSNSISACTCWSI